MFIKSTVIPETEEEQPKRKFSENNNMASISSRPYLSVLNPRSAQSSSDMEFLHSPIQTHKSNTITKSRGDITHIPLRPPYESSSSSLQQKLRHILKRGGSVNSLRHDKTQSVVHYKSLRKSETVLVLSSHQFPTQSTFSKQQQKQQLNVLNGGTSTEKIRPMNRWRHSTHSIGLVSSSSCSSHLSHHDSARQITTTTTTATTTQSNRASGIDFPPASLENINQIGSRNVFSESWSSNVQNIAAIDTKLDEQQTNNTGTKKKHITTTTTIKIFHPFTCKMCLVDIEKEEEETTLLQCNCQFCTECLRAYIDFEISEGAYDISCPDSQCPAQGNITLAEITQLTTSSLLKKHHRYRLNREIELDKWRAWCPRAGCETICYVDREAENNSELQTSTSNLNEVGIKLNDMTKKSVPVECPTCHDKFCLVCRKTWHPDKICKGNGQWLISEGLNEIGLTFDNDVIKGCPMCGVLIEKDDGCAQMMCKRCKHVFCWYCLASLDDDFLLRHYDKGPCKNKLGHSRASIIWHRAQVIGIFAGFGILLLIASPLLLLAAPCIICCKCRSCGDINRNEVKDDIDDVSPNLQS